MRTSKSGSATGPSLHFRATCPHRGSYAPVARQGTLGRMSWMDRFRRGSTKMSRPARDAQRTGSTRGRAGDRMGPDPPQAWTPERRGVEGFVEPRTAVSDVTLLLVAHDGEWTRRRVPSVKWAHKFANQNGVPSYDAAVVGYPERMREYNRRRKNAL